MHAIESKFNPNTILPSFNSFTIIEDTNSISRLRMLRQRSFNLALFHHHQQQHRSQIIQHCYNPNFNHNRSNLQFIKQVIFARRTSMAENEKKEIKSPSTAEKTEEKDKVKVKKELPQPPEKPLPGDCCGSGCVRCVWDIYYDELDDYNKLLKDLNDSS